MPSSRHLYPPPPTAAAPAHSLQQHQQHPLEQPPSRYDDTAKAVRKSTPSLPMSGASSMAAAAYPLQSIHQPHAHDVLCGRGGQSNTHPGNTQWRMLVAANKELYVSLPKKQKMLLSQSIVNAVRSQDPPGRFLQKDARTDLWCDVGDKRAQEKTSQALREGAPEIRLKLKEQKGDSGGGGRDGGGKEGSPVDNNNSNKHDRDSESGDLSPTNSSVDEDSDEDINSKKQGSSSSSKRKAPPEKSLSLASSTSNHEDHRPVVPLPDPARRLESREQMPPPQQKEPATSQLSLRKPPPSVIASGSSMSNNRDGYENPLQAYSDDTHQSVTPKASSRNFAPPPPQSYYHQPQYSYDRDRYDSYYGQHHHQQKQRQYYPPQEQAAVPPPPAALDPNGDFSFGSIHLTDAEQALLETGVSFGATVNCYNTTNNTNGDRQQPQQYYQNHQPPPRHHSSGYDDEPLPVDGGLEPIGFSFGSVMSIGTAAGEAAAIAAENIRMPEPGVSFGSVMSYTYTGGGGHGRKSSYGGVPYAPPTDGGFQDIGTSFGSLSLKEGERERIIAEAERDMMMLSSPTKEQRSAAASGVAMAPPMLSARRSKGNLLDCSDTDSEGEEESTEASAQKSANWAKLQATIAAQDQRARPALTSAVPPRLFSGPNPFQPGTTTTTTLSIPTTGLDRDFSQMSAISVGEDFAPDNNNNDDNSVVLPNASSSRRMSGVGGRYDDGMPPPPQQPFVHQHHHAMEQEDEERNHRWYGQQSLEYTYLNRGSSLADESFEDSKPAAR